MVKEFENNNKKTGSSGSAGNSNVNSIHGLDATTAAALDFLNLQAAAAAATMFPSLFQPTAASSSSASANLDQLFQNAYLTNQFYAAASLLPFSQQQPASIPQTSVSSLTQPFGLLNQPQQQQQQQPQQQQTKQSKSSSHHHKSSTVNSSKSSNQNQPASSSSLGAQQQQQKQQQQQHNPQTPNTFDLLFNPALLAAAAPYFQTTLPTPQQQPQQQSTSSYHSIKNLIEPTPTTTTTNTTPQQSTLGFNNNDFNLWASMLQAATLMGNASDLFMPPVPPTSTSSSSSSSQQKSQTSSPSYFPPPTQTSTPTPTQQQQQQQQFFNNSSSSKKSSSSTNNQQHKHQHSQSPSSSSSTSSKLFFHDNSNRHSTTSSSNQTNQQQKSSSSINNEQASSVYKFELNNQTNNNNNNNNKITNNTQPQQQQQQQPTTSQSQPQTQQQQQQQQHYQQQLQEKYELDELKIKYPLKLKWKRETIVKEIHKNGIKGDVIYYSPCGKKLRTLQEIERYLQKHNTVKNLTRDHFTFSSKLIVGTFLLPKKANNYVNNEFNNSKSKEVNFYILNENDIINKIRELNPKYKQFQQQPPINLADNCSLENQLKQITSFAAANPTSSSSSTSNTATVQLKPSLPPPQQPPPLQSSSQTQINKLIDERAERKRLLIEKKQEEKLQLNERKLKEKWFEGIINREMKKQVDDLQEKLLINDLPSFKQLNKSYKSIDDCLMVFEFVNNFKMQLCKVCRSEEDGDGNEDDEEEEDSVDEDALKQLNTFCNLTLKQMQLGLKNRNKKYTEIIMNLLKILLKLCLKDPGLDDPKHTLTKSGQKLSEIKLTNYSCSEILRIYVNEKQSKQKEFISKNNFNLFDSEFTFIDAILVKLENNLFQLLDSNEKCKLLSYLCNDLLTSKRCVSEIDSTIEDLSKYKHEKWQIECKLRSLRVKKYSQLKINDQEKAASSSNNNSNNEEKDKEKEKEKETTTATPATTTTTTATSNNDDTIKQLDKKFVSLTKRQTQLKKCADDAFSKLRGGMYLGQDRYCRNYWLLSKSGGIYIESSKVDDEKGENDQEKNKPEANSENENEKMVVDCVKKEDESTMTTIADIVESKNVEIKQENEEKMCVEDDAVTITAAIDNDNDSLPLDLSCRKSNQQSENVCKIEIDNDDEYEEGEVRKVQKEQQPEKEDEEKGEKVSDEEKKAEIDDLIHVNKVDEYNRQLQLNLNSKLLKTITHKEIEAIIFDHLQHNKESDIDKEVYFNGYWWILDEKKLVDQLEHCLARRGIRERVLAKNLATCKEQLNSTCGGGGDSGDSYEKMKLFVKDDDENDDADNETTAASSSSGGGVKKSQQKTKVVNENDTENDKLKNNDLANYELDKQKYDLEILEIVYALEDRVFNANLQSKSTTSLNSNSSDNEQTSSSSCKSSENSASADDVREKTEATTTTTNGSKTSGDDDDDDCLNAFEMARKRLIELESNIERRYLKVPFARKQEIKITNSNTNDSDSNNSDDDDEDDDDEEDNEEEEDEEESNSKNNEENNNSENEGENIENNGDTETKDKKSANKNSDKINDDEQAQQQQQQSSKSNNDANNDNNVTFITPQLARWRNAVKQTTSVGQLAILIDQLDSCIAWDKSIMKVICQICNCDDNEDKLLLCDSCDRGNHTYCFKPPLKRIPDGDWYCNVCISKSKGEKLCIVCGQTSSDVHKCDKCVKYFHSNCLPQARSIKHSKWLCVSCAGPLPRQNSKTNRSNSMQQSKSAKNEHQSSSANGIGEATNAPSSSSFSSSSSSGNNEATPTTGPSAKSTKTTTDTDNKTSSNVNESTVPPFICTSKRAAAAIAATNIMCNTNRRSSKATKTTTSHANEENSENTKPIETQPETTTTTTSTIETTPTTNNKRRHSASAKSSPNDDNSSKPKPNGNNDGGDSKDNENDDDKDEGGGETDAHNDDSPKLARKKRKCANNTAANANKTTPKSSPTTSSNNKTDKKSSTNSTQQKSRPSSDNKKSLNSKKSEKEMSLCKNLLSDLCKNENSWPFLQPVDPKIYPNYYEVIEKPMDIQTIKKKFKDNLYQNKDDFAYDCRLIFDNCEYFNEDDSQIGQAGHRLRAFFENKWIKLFD